MKVVYDFYNNTLPADLKNLFHFSSEIHTYELNSTYKKLLYIPRIATASYGNNSLKYLCANLWNDTFKNGIAIDKYKINNVTLDKILNKSHLKKTLKKHFLYNYTLV